MKTNINVTCPFCDKEFIVCVREYCDLNKKLEGRMSIDREVDEELQRLFDKIDAIKEYLGIAWEWDKEMIVGAKKK